MEKTVTKVEKIKAAMPSFTRVAAYARVSSGKDEMLNSLAAQVSYFSDYIQRHPGWLYVGVYTDEGLTGTKSGRPEFMRLLDDCRGGKIDLVLTKSISRFARNTVDLLETVRELKSIGVDVYFEEQSIHTMSGDGELMLTILASYAQAESLSASENCKWRIRKQFENGELATLRFLFGYQVVKGKVEIHSEHGAIARMIFDDYIAGKGGGKIAEKLKRMNVDTVKNGIWNCERVLSIIKNEKYTGNALLQKTFIKDHLSKTQVWNRGRVPKYYAEDTHPAIIDQTTFDLAQSILHKRSSHCRTKSDPRNRYPFRSIIHCGVCGKKYNRKNRKGKVIWYCSTFLQEGKLACPSRQIPESVLYSLSSEVLGLDEFDAEAFGKEITEILVPEASKLIFVFRDGRTAEKAWQHKSRRDSWTDEMREAAREHAKRRR